MGPRTIKHGTRAAAATAALAAMALLASSAPAEHSLLEQVSIGPSGGNAGIPAAWLGASADGERVFFRTGESLTGDDTDVAWDVYARSGGQTTLLSPGEADDDAVFIEASDDGSVVVIVTDEQLSGEDGDEAADYYALRQGGATLLSSGPTADDEGNWTPTGGRLSADGTAFAFTTSDDLIDDDADGNDTDVYLYRTGEPEPTLVSTGPTDPGSGLHLVDAVADDGSRVVFESNAPLVAGDEGNWDVYAYDVGAAEPTLVSDGTDLDTFFAGASPDASAVVFRTGDRLRDSDTDDNIDLYKFTGTGAAQHVSTGPDGGNSDSFQPAQLRAVSADGSRAVFSSEEPLVAADVDGGGTDIWVNDDGVTTLVSAPAPGSIHSGSSAFFAWASPDASRIIFDYTGLLTGDDTDSGIDVYERADGTTTLLSSGTIGGTIADSSFAGASADGSRVLFVTDGRLEPEDTDGRIDVYERHAGGTTLISSGPGTGNGDHDVVETAISGNGAHAWFSTAERMLPSDTDGVTDVYEKSFPAPVNTSPPTISGTPVAGGAVLCSNGTWANGPTAFTYRWNRDGAAIGGATSAPYVILPADVGRQLTCTVTAANAGGSTAATSAAVTPTAAQTPPPPPPPNGPAACANLQRGTGGKDRLIGTAAGDRLKGRGGNDRLNGGKGDDCLSGGGGKDRLRGGGGKDKLTGGRGVDRFDGGAGNDVVNSRDKRRETVRCGKGARDRVTADKKDKLRGCERVKRR